MQVGSERGEEYIKQREREGVGEGRRSFHDRSFAGLGYWSNKHVACMSPPHKQQK